MLPAIEFFRPQEIIATGVGFKRPGNDDFQYYLPFSGQINSEGKYGDSHVKFAIAVSERRVFVASDNGDMALIDLDADAVICRGRLTADRPQIAGLQISSDSRFLYVRGNLSLYIVNAGSLDIVQEWTEIERTDSGWQRNTLAVTDYEVGFQRRAAGSLESLDIAGPVREIGGSRIAARLRTGDFDKVKRSGYYVFDVTTGAIERHVGAASVLAFQAMRLHTDARSGLQVGSHYNLKCPDVFEEVVAREAMITLSAASWSSERAIGLVDDLAERMEHGTSALIRCGSINVRFVIAGEVVSNTAFFARFVDERWVNAAPALRRLLTAYLEGIEGGEGCMPWHHQGGGSGFALRALMLLDLDAYDVYRLYLDKGDLEHDQWPYNFYKEYVDRRGWRNEADVGFGIYLTMLGCSDTDVDANHPIQAAERLMSAERLVEIIRAEATRLNKTDWTGFNTQDYRAHRAGEDSISVSIKNQYALQRLARYFAKLKPTTPYAHKVIAALPNFSFWRFLHG